MGIMAIQEKKKETTIRITKDTLNLLKEVGKKKETYDDLIRRLINTSSLLPKVY
ncbi:MAG: hypothetical protein J7K36_08965 [Archaeoglobaceae archaeon]|nr:hypothetical protein [Archaeoglobaceae archaeon]